MIANTEKEIYVLQLILKKQIIVDCERGEVFSKRGSVGIRKLSGHLRYDGYVMFGFTRYVNGKKKVVAFLGNRLVWIAHTLKPIPIGIEIDHINRIRSDNKISNLKDVIPSENSSNRADTTSHGEDHGNSKLNEDNVKEILRQRGVTKQKELAQKFGVHVSLICAVQKRKVWKHVSI